MHTGDLFPKTARERDGVSREEVNKIHFKQTHKINKELKKIYAKKKGFCNLFLTPNIRNEHLF